MVFSILSLLYFLKLNIFDEEILISIIRNMDDFNAVIALKFYIERDVVASLSGGESKRIEIATVLSRENAKILVFDEPEAGIDLWSFTSLIDAFQKLKNESGKSLLVISHQERILEIADYIVVIADGNVRAFGEGKDVLPQLLKEEKESKCPLGKDKKGENN